MKKLLTLLFALAIAGVAHASQAEANVGQEVTFTVATESGTQPFFYQWLKNGFAVTTGAATGQTFVLKNVQVADAGVYSVRVSNAAGSIVSDNATLTVKAPVVKPGLSTTTIFVKIP